MIHSKLDHVEAAVLVSGGDPGAAQRIHAALAACVARVAVFEAEAPLETLCVALRARRSATSSRAQLWRSSRACPRAAVRS